MPQLAALLLLLASLTAAQQVRLAGDWAVALTAPGGGTPVTLPIAPPDVLTVVHERYEALPEFDAKAAPWRRGARLTGVVAEECTVQGALDPASLVVRAGPSPAARVFVKGVDYEADLAAGTLGRLPGGAIAAGQPVSISYRFTQQRIDSIVRTADGKMLLKPGLPHTVVPEMPALAPGETRLANVYLHAGLPRLSEDNLFPILEERFPSAAQPTKLLPKTMAKLRSGAPLRILAWGDSVSTYNRYQSMFVAGLQQRFPRARIELITEAWGGRNTGSYLREPPGSAHNYQEKVLAARPDLIVSEFVNDAGLTGAQVEERYTQLLKDFQGIGAEWIILSPHYVRPDWMKLTRQREIDDDPRPYVTGIRRFAEAHQVALADGAARYGRLWRQGIPYMTLMENNINHPNLFGHSIFADALLALFPAAPSSPSAAAGLFPKGWDPKAAGDRVMKSLIAVTGPEVKGAHDADLVLVGDRAFVATMDNDRQPGESAEWPFIYLTLAVVDLKTLTLERRIPVAKGGQAFANEPLPEGACFVPRLLKRDAQTLRFFFASEAPRQRQSRTYYRDFNLQTLEFEPRIHRAKIETAAGVFDMQPNHLYEDAQRHGFAREAKDFGLYMIDSFKVFDGQTYAVVNNYPIGQNSWAVLNEAQDTFRVLGHFNQPATWKLTEAAVNRLPDGTWLAISRQEAGTRNYTFSTSKDGRTWSMNEYRAFVPNGTNSKPLFEKFKGVYYLGWQEATRINDVARSVFNIDVSTDGVQWERKYRFESADSFQYPGLREHQGSVFLWATQGAKERIMFGRLE